MGDDDMQKNGEATERKREIEEDDDGDDSSDGETQSECIVRHLAALLWSAMFATGKDRRSHEGSILTGSL